MLVGPPGEVKLRRILTELALRVELRVEPALVDLVLADVHDRPGVRPILSTALVSRSGCPVPGHSAAGRLDIWSRRCSNLR
jgi:hypothetical protein